MTLFKDAPEMRRKTLSHYDNLASQCYRFFSGAFCYTLFGIKAQFIIRKEGPTVLARRASYDKKTLARQVIPLAPSYWTAISSAPSRFENFRGTPLSKYLYDRKVEGIIIRSRARWHEYGRRNLKYLCV